MVNRNKTSGGDRVRNEIAHGQRLSEKELPESAWGWGGAAGALRARRRATMVAASADLRAGRRVLEIGCGTGLFTTMLAETGADILAIELSPHLADLARQRNYSVGHVTIVNERFEEYVDDTKFDAVIAVSVLHHLEVERALQHCYELLRPGGRISFSEPNMLNPQIFLERRLRGLLPKHKVDTSPDETAFLKKGITKTIEHVGFRDIVVKPFDWLHPATPASLIPLVSKMGSWLESFPVLREFSGSLMISATRP